MLETCGCPHSPLTEHPVKSYHDKHIPEEYLRASEHQRWALLQGLMDSDGCIGKVKAKAYVSTEKQLVWMCESY